MTMNSPSLLVPTVPIVPPVLMSPKRISLIGTSSVAPKTVRSKSSYSVLVVSVS